MDDLISRQALMKEFSDFVRASNNSDFARTPTWNDAVSLVGSMPSAQPDLSGYSDRLWRNAYERGKAESQQRWIPCSERLPFVEYGESDEVLATCGYLNVEDTSVRWIRELYFNGGNWCYPTGKTYEQKVYAWMPLPEPYRGG